MADTGAPWNLPYPLPTDLVRDGADAIKDLAEATADGLDAAGGLVAVKHVLKTDTFVSGSVAAGGNVAVTGMSITHAMADAGNRLIISAFFGATANAFTNQGNVGMAIHDGTSLIAVGASPGNRTAVSAGGPVLSTGNNDIVTMPSITFVHEPNDTTSRTYTVRVINMDTGPQALYVNRSNNDSNTAYRPRSVSGFVIQEVKV